MDWSWVQPVIGLFISGVIFGLGFAWAWKKITSKEK